MLTALIAAAAIATGPGLAVSHGGSIYVDGKKIARGSQPAWSPSGKQIVFNRDGQIFVIDANAKNERRVVKRAPGLHWPAKYPAWSRDGRTIAFMGTRDVLTVELSSGVISNLTNADYSWRGNWTPAYSPDRKTIALARNTAPSQTDIFLMRLDGKGLRRLTQTNGRDDDEFAPTWSPDGQTIVYSSTRDGNSELYAIDSNGANERRLTDTPDVEEQFPRFSRDGRRILYVHRGGVAHMRADGSDARELGAGTSADWR